MVSCCHWLVFSWYLQNAQKVSNLFGGTREKCVGCTKTVYPIEKVAVYNHLSATNYYQIDAWWRWIKQVTRQCWTWNLFTTPVLKGFSEWDSIPQKLLQVHTWRVYHQPIKLHCPWRKALLQAPPHPALQGERELQPAGERSKQDRQHNRCRNCCRILMCFRCWYVFQNHCLLVVSIPWWCFSLL